MDDQSGIENLCLRSEEEIKCLEEIPKKHTNWFVIGKQLDAGAYGAIFSANTNNGIVIVKVFSGSKQEIIHEICFQHLASLYKLAPVVLDYWICGDNDKKALLVMDYGGNTTLEAFIEDIAKTKISDKLSLTRSLQVYKAMINLYYLTLKLNMEVKIFHQDLHLRNVLLTVDKNGIITAMKIIDYGKSEHWSDFEDVINSKISQASLPDNFNGIAHMYKMLYADLMAPLEFYYEKFLLKNDTTAEYKNPVVRWVYNDYIKDRTSLLCLLQKKGWYIENVKDEMDNIIEGVRMELGDRLETYNDYDIDDDKLLRMSTRLIKL